MIKAWYDKASNLEINLQCRKEEVGNFAVQQFDSLVFVWGGYGTYWGLWYLLGCYGSC